MDEKTLQPGVGAGAGQEAAIAREARGNVMAVTRQYAVVGRCFII